MIIAILWPASACVALLIGFWFGAAYYDLKGMKQAVQKFSESMANDPTNPNETIPKAVIIDPTDLEQQVKMEQEEMRRKLNPEMYIDEMPESDV